MLASFGSAFLPPPPIPLCFAVFMTTFDWYKRQFGRGGRVVEGGLTVRTREVLARGEKVLALAFFFTRRPAYHECCCCHS